MREKTPFLQSIKDSSLLGVRELPGLPYVAESRKGKHTKAQNLSDLINDAYPLHLMRRVQGGGSFLKLRVGFRKMNDVLLRDGGIGVFGGWWDWVGRLRA